MKPCKSSDYKKRNHAVASQPSSAHGDTRSAAFPIGVGHSRGPLLQTTKMPHGQRSFDFRLFETKRFQKKWAVAVGEIEILPRGPLGNLAGFSCWSELDQSEWFEVRTNLKVGASWVCVAKKMNLDLCIFSGSLVLGWAAAAVLLPSTCDPLKCMTNV